MEKHTVIVWSDTEVLVKYIEASNTKILEDLVNNARFSIHGNTEDVRWQVCEGHLKCIAPSHMSSYLNSL